MSEIIAMFDKIVFLNDDALIDELIPAREMAEDCGPTGYLAAIVLEIWERGLGYVLTDDDKSYLN
jgi:hypothetical protein